jgi:quercetin dioxygenase-like cupin family protein
MALQHGASGEVVLLDAHQAAPARTQAVIKVESLEVVQLALPPGGRLPVHAAPGEITLFGLWGTLSLELSDRTLQLGPHQFVHLARGEPHAVRTIGGACALLTLCLHREPPPQAPLQKEEPCI